MSLKHLRMRPMTAWAAIFTLAVVYAIAGNRQRALEGQEAHDALCVLKGDLETRIANGEALLQQYPGPIFGIPRTTIESSIAGQQKTLKALRKLDCPPPPTLP